MNPPNTKIQTVINPLMRCVSTFDGSRTSAADYKQYKAAHRRYNQSEKGKARYRRYYIRHSDQIKAKNAVNHAIRDGRLISSSKYKYRYCPKQAEQYHHYLGYKPEYKYAVTPVCKKCHRKLHKNLSVPAPTAVYFEVR